MSAEQRDDNLGIDSGLRNRDPAAYDAALKRKLQKLRSEMGLCDDDARGSSGSVQAAPADSSPRALGDAEPAAAPDPGRT